MNAMQAPQASDFTRTVEKTPLALRILVVDDEALIRWSLAETLNELGHHVVEVSDGRGTELAVRGASPAFDVVLLDLRLPDSNDLSLLASIRAWSPHTQVILMTAFGRPEVMRGALELGAFHVLSKPFEMGDVASLVVQAHAAGLGRETH
jgi:two-component system, NtrC family, response regulator AtoC